MQDGYQRKTNVVFIAREVSRRYSNGRTFGSRAPTYVRCFENRVSCAGYPDGQTNYSIFQKRYTEDVTVVQQLTHVADPLMCIEHIINPV
jgi:hypothetical protein